MKQYWVLTKVLPNQENQEAINNFLLSLKLSNRSDQTIRNYKRFLEIFFGDKEDTYSSLSPNQILEWFKVNQSHVKESSYKRYLSIISSFYNYCVRESLIEISPIKRRWFPHLPKPVPKYLEKGEIAKIQQESERSSIRNQVLVEFLLTSGCRLGEVHKLNIEDIDLKSRTARVIGKGKKIRFVFFSEKCAVLLESYLEDRQEEKGSAPLFMAFKNKKRLNAYRIHEIINELGEKAGLKRLHSHRFRHTFATNLLAKGAELSFISQMLGHSDIDTTQIYARLSNHQIISLYRKFMG